MDFNRNGAELDKFDSDKALADFLTTLQISNGTEEHVKNMCLYAQFTEYREDKELKYAFVYDPMTDVIRFNPKHADFARYDFDFVRVHELSHRMNELQYRTWENETFQRAIGTSAEKLANVQDEILATLAPGGVYENDMALSDIISALSYGMLPVPAGHTADYWNRNDMFVSSEIFANISVIDVLGYKSEKILKTHFVELLNAYKGVVQ